jgi:hypothetical protein
VNPAAAKPGSTQIITSLAKLGGAAYVVTAHLQAPKQGAAQQRGRRRQHLQLQVVEDEVITANGLAAATASDVAEAEQSCSRMLVLVDSSTVSQAAAAMLRRRWPGSELLLMGYLADCISCYRMLLTDSYMV